MTMSEHMYKVIELVGTSPESWEKAATVAVEEAAKHLKDLRIGEVTEMDMQISEGKVVAYRTKVKVSFRYQCFTNTHGVESFLRVSRCRVDHSSSHSARGLRDRRLPISFGRRLQEGWSPPAHRFPNRRGSHARSGDRGRPGEGGLR